jgi:hypothetical protein
MHEQLRLAVPLRVVGELDAKKATLNRKLNDRAASRLAVLSRVLSSDGEVRRGVRVTVKVTVPALGLGGEL